MSFQFHFSASIKMEEEKKLVTIKPLPEPGKEPPQEPVPGKEPSAPKKVGRPKTRPPKVEKHEATPARLEALKKARIVKAAKRIEKEKNARFTHQGNITGQAFPTQGYTFGPQIDLNASMAQSAPAFEQGKSTPMPYQNPTFGRPEAAEQLTRVESLLNRLLYDQNSQNAPPQNILQEQPMRLDAHKSSVFNTNPYLSRRYGRR